MHDYEFEFNCHASQAVHRNFNTGNVVTLIHLILALYIQRFLPEIKVVESGGQVLEKSTSQDSGCTEHNSESCLLHQFKSN